MHVPAQAIITPCVEGCSAKIMWEFDPGEPMTYEYPGEPEAFFPREGAQHDGDEEGHLNALCADSTYDGNAGELYRQLAQWELLIDAARILARSSRMYLNGRPNYIAEMNALRANDLEDLPY